MSDERLVLEYAPAERCSTSDNELDLALPAGPVWHLILSPLCGLLVLVSLVALAAAGVGMMMRRPMGSWAFIAFVLLVLLPLLLAACAACAWCITRIQRAIRYGHLPVRITTGSGQLTIECPCRWGLRSRYWPIADVGRVDLYSAGRRLDLSRILYVKLNDTRNMDLAELTLWTRDRALEARLRTALCRALGVAEDGRLRRGTSTPAAMDRGGQEIDDG